MTPLGWGGHTHLSITRRVLAALPMLTDAEKAEILRGEEAPDRDEPILVHWQKHFQEPGKRGQAVDALVEEFNRGTLYDLGRAVHRIEDLGQPYHADRNPLLLPEHAAFESWADRTHSVERIAAPTLGFRLLRLGVAEGGYRLAERSAGLLPHLRDAWRRQNVRDLENLTVVDGGTLWTTQGAALELILLWLRQRGRA